MLLSVSVAVFFFSFVVTVLDGGVVLFMLGVVGIRVRFSKVFIKLFGFLILV